MVAFLIAGHILVNYVDWVLTHAPPGDAIALKSLFGGWGGAGSAAKRLLKSLVSLARILENALADIDSVDQAVPGQTSAANKILVSLKNTMSDRHIVE